MIIFKNPRDKSQLQKLAKFNNGFRYLLVVIDVLSKYAWVRPLKHKTGKELKAALENIFIESKRKPFIIHTDKGKEFKNQLVLNFLKSNVCLPE